MRQGLTVVFEDAEKAVEGLRALYQAGYRKLDLHSPYQVSKAREFLPLKPGRVSAAVFCGGTVGALAGYLLQYVTSVWIYPHQIGGTRLHAWPAFLPFTFEAGVLMASLAAFFSVLVLSGLPRYNHPVFDIPGFDRISRDRFAVVVEKSDGMFEPEETRRLLMGLEGGTVHEF